MYCNCCKKVATGRLKCCAEPKKNRCKIVFLIGSIFFACCIVAGSLTGIILSGNVPSGARQSTCGVVSFLDEVSLGRPEDKWIGIGAAVSHIENILGKFDDIVQNLTLVDTDFTELDAAVDTAENAILLLYTAADGQTAIRPDPEIGGTYLPTYVRVILTYFES